MDTFKLAWRNLWRAKRRTLVTVGATAFALFMTIIYSGLITGYLEDMEATVVDLEVGDLQIHGDSYLKRPSLYERVEDSDALVKALEAEGFEAAPRLLGAGLAALHDSSAGVNFRAIEPELDRGVSEVYTKVEKGKWVSDEDPRGVVIGKRLAHTLGAGLGDEIVVLSQGADGSMANDAYPVRGILGAISEPVDRGGIYMTASAFRELMVVPEGAHQIIARRPASMTLEAASARAREIAGDQADTRSWRELMPTMASMLDSAKAAMVLVFGVVYFAIAIVILNAMLMAVFERIREFGVLKALGVGPGGVLALVYVETLLQTLLAIGIAVLLSLPVNYYMVNTGLDLSAMGDVSVIGVSWNPVWKSAVDLSTYTTPITTLSVIVLLAVLYPALKAAFIKPVTAMRYR